MPSKFSYGVLRTLCVLAALLGIVAAAAAEADKPIATLYTHFAGRKCHCGSTKQTILVGEAGAGNCYFLPNDTKTLSAEVEGDWNGTLPRYIPNRPGPGRWLVDSVM
ncbi:hypothetical protein F5X98DRAFT_333066 [Xylaria grammica]|nr:hypothetical protein F5X98DRAFT_333066 [Xylaria grammica]